jgi:hypothetical protein
MPVCPIVGMNQVKGGKGCHTMENGNLGVFVQKSSLSVRNMRIPVSNKVILVPID